VDLLREPPAAKTSPRPVAAAAPTKTSPRPLPSSTSILKPSLIVRGNTGNSVTFADHKSSKTESIIQPLTLDRITSAQFEDEATTCIIAALEAEDQKLLGEGIEDYSDDDDDNATPTEQRKIRTYSTDSFIKNLQKHGDLQQYRSSPISASSRHVSSTSLIGSHHVTSSMLSAGFLPGVPDGSAIESFDRVSSLLGEDSDDNFVQGFNETLRKSASNLAASASDGEQEVEGERATVDRTLSDIKEGDEEEEQQQQDVSSPAVNNPMKSTHVTKNLNIMGQRLKMMQKAGSSSLRSSLRSQKSLMMENEGSGDQLLNSLSNASKNETNGFWRKIRYEYTDLIAPQMPRSIARISRLLFFVVFPFLSVAVLLFYMFDNPMAGNSGTSVSWWIIFVARQGLLFEFARVGEVFWVEIMALRSKLFTTAFGPYVALAIIQSKGWPYMCIFWPVLDFCFLYGSNPFVRHWVS
jgi:hypothetical protein